VPDEAARFLAELRLLGAPSWRQYEARAVDGLLWSLTASGAISINAGGANAYPPDGDRETSTFDRLLLAVERLLGRELWPSKPVQPPPISDERDCIEHAVLAACRSWASANDPTASNPEGATEIRFEKALLPHLKKIIEADDQGSVFKQGEPSLDYWKPGKVDVVIEWARCRAWVELKWCKQKGTFGNCLWDAAKVSAALRQGRTRFGYLLVAAPVSIWAGALPLEARVTKVSCHRGASLVEDYPYWWGGWCEENRNTYPSELPTPVMTAPVGRVRYFGPPDSPWELRLIRVEAPGDETYAPPLPVTAGKPVSDRMPEASCRHVAARALPTVPLAPRCDAVTPLMGA
jgi:hypothetical protein